MMFTCKNIVAYLALTTVALTVSADSAARDLTVCDTFKACYLINIQTQQETVLTGNDSFELDPTNDRGYSIRCDVNGEASMDFIKFFYNGEVKDEFGEPRFMNGDAQMGEYINDVKYLSTCGVKTLKIEGNVWSNPCFVKEFEIDVRNTGGKPCVSGDTKAPITTPVAAPVAAPVNPPTGAPVSPPTMSPTKTPVKPPTKAPVKPPTKAPVKPPTQAPVKPPTQAPVKPPTKAPVKPPTKAPVKPPTKSPVKPPTRHPVKPPTRAPIKPPVKPPTRAPVKSPTKSPVKPPTSACILPPKTSDFSIITWGDATIAGHSLYKGVGIGGTFYDGSPTEYGTVDRTMSYIRHLDPNEKFHFNGGLTVGQTVPQSMYDQFIYLASNAVSAKFNNGYEVFVLTRGGTYDLYDFVYEGQGENNGKTLVVFNTHEDVTLTSANGRQFGPSVLAPFSKVIVLGDAGYVDGFIVGKTVHTSGPNASGLQFHGDGYTGPLKCR